jgi:hypothetical protein
MKEPLRTRYAPGYDLFKLVVAVILTIILIVLLLRERDRRFASLETAVTTIAETTSLVLSTMTLSLPASTSTSTPTPTELPATETAPVEAAPTEIPSAEEPSIEQPQASDPNECPSNPTRIHAGVTVRVLDWLNFRAAPGIGKTILHTNRPGTEMEVIGGPVCTPQTENPPRAYLWWNVRMEDGREGWSAEAPLNFPNYFMEPVP